MDGLGFGVSVGIEGLFKGKGFVEVCFKFTLCGPLSELIEVSGGEVGHQHFPFLRTEGVGECAGDERFGAGCGVKEETFGGEEGSCFGERQAAREFEQGVKAFGGLQDVLFFVIDHVVSTEGTGEFDALGGANACDMGAHDLCDLDGDDPDSARTSVE